MRRSATAVYYSLRFKLIVVVRILLSLVTVASHAVMNRDVICNCLLFAKQRLGHWNTCMDDGATLDCVDDECDSCTSDKSSCALNKLRI